MGAGPLSLTTQEGTPRDAAIGASLPPIRSPESDVSSSAASAFVCLAFSTSCAFTFLASETSILSDLDCHFQKVALWASCLRHNRFLSKSLPNRFILIVFPLSQTRPVQNIRRFWGPSHILNELAPPRMVALFHYNALAHRPRLRPPFGACGPDKGSAFWKSLAIALTTAFVERDGTEGIRQLVAKRLDNLRRSPPERRADIATGTQHDKQGHPRLKEPVLVALCEWAQRRRDVDGTVAFAWEKIGDISRAETIKTNIRCLAEYRAQCIDAMSCSQRRLIFTVHDKNDKETHNSCTVGAET